MAHIATVVATCCGGQAYAFKSGMIWCPACNIVLGTGIHQSQVVARRHVARKKNRMFNVKDYHTTTLTES